MKIGQVHLLALVAMLLTKLKAFCMLASKVPLSTSLALVLLRGYV